MIIPAEVLRDGHPKIFCSVCCFEYLIMKGILGLQWLFWPCYMEHLAFAWVKLHVPGSFPFLQGIEVCLEGVSIFRGVNCQVDCRVICEKSYLRLNVLWQVIDIEQEEERPKNRSLWHTRCQRDLHWALPLQHYGLGSTHKESSNPI